MWLPVGWAPARTTHPPFCALQAYLTHLRAALRTQTLQEETANIITCLGNPNVIKNFRKDQSFNQQFLQEVRHGPQPCLRSLALLCVSTPDQFSTTSPIHMPAELSCTAASCMIAHLSRQLSQASRCNARPLPAHPSTATL